MHPRIRRALEMEPDRCCIPHEVDGIAPKALFDASADGQTSQHLRYILPNYLCTFTLSSHRHIIAQKTGHGEPFGVVQACSQLQGWQLDKA